MKLKLNNNIFTSNPMNFDISNNKFKLAYLQIILFSTGCFKYSAIFYIIIRKNKNLNNFVNYQNFLNKITA